MNVRTSKLALQLLAVLHILAGLTLPYLAELPQFDFYNRHLLGAFAANSPESLALAKFMTGILGPTVASWGLLFLFIVNVTFASRSRMGWCVMVIAVSGWCLYDIFLSVSATVLLNVIIDVVVLVMLLGPLLNTWPYFFSYQPVNTSPDPA